MANPTKNFGLKPYKPGNRHDFRTQVLPKTTGAANYEGDPLTLVAAGTYTKASAGGSIDAICASYASATDTEIQAWIPNSNQEWLINSNASVALTDRGGAFDIEVPGSPDTTLNLSDIVLDISSIGTTGGCILLDKHPNDAWGEDDVRCIVRINESKRVGIGVGVVT